MTKEQIAFCNKLKPYIVSYGNAYGIKCYAGVLAQAILESNWGKSKLSSKYFNFFGMKAGSSYKGKVVRLTTREESMGTSVTIKDGFRVYSNVAQGVEGYFKFTNTKRYANLKGVTDCKTFFELLKADGYATSSKYVSSLMNLVNTCNLEQVFKTSNNATAPTNPTQGGQSVSNKKSEEEIAREVIRGKWGVMPDRKRRLEQAGYNYERIRKLVNKYYGKR